MIHSSSLLFTCWHPDDDWKRIAAYKLVHAMQLTQWNVDSGTLTSPYNLILKEATARHTEYALGYLDRYDLCTDGPVPIWLAEGGELHEAPEFLLYEIGASLVGGLGSHEQRQRLLPSDMLPGFAMRDVSFTKHHRRLVHLQLPFQHPIQRFHSCLLRLVRRQSLHGTDIVPRPLAADGIVCQR